MTSRNFSIFLKKEKKIHFPLLLTFDNFIFSTKIIKCWWLLTKIWPRKREWTFIQSNDHNGGGWWCIVVVEPFHFPLLFIHFHFHFHDDRINFICKKKQKIYTRYSTIFWMIHSFIQWNQIHRLIKNHSFDNSLMRNDDQKHQ